MHNRSVLDRRPKKFIDDNEHKRENGLPYNFEGRSKKSSKSRSQIQQRTKDPIETRNFGANTTQKSIKFNETVNYCHENSVMSLRETKSDIMPKSALKKRKPISPIPVAPDSPLPGKIKEKQLEQKACEPKDNYSPII